MRNLTNKSTLMESHMKKLRTIANAIGVATLALLPAFNAQAENTSGIHPAGAYMGQLSMAITEKTQDIQDRNRVRGYSQVLDAVLAKGASPDLQYFQVGSKDGKTRSFDSFIGPNYDIVSVCVEANGRPLGAWNIHAKGITPTPVGSSCLEFGQNIVRHYKSLGVKFVKAPM